MTAKKAVGQRRLGPSTARSPGPLGYISTYATRLFYPVTLVAGNNNVHYEYSYQFQQAYPVVACTSPYTDRYTPIVNDTYLTY